MEVNFCYRNSSTVIVFNVRSRRLSSKKRVKMLLRYIYLYTFIKKKGFETKYGRRVKGKNKLLKEWKLTGQINARCEPRDVFVRSAARMKRLREGEYKCIILDICVYRIVWLRHSSYVLYYSGQPYAVYTCGDIV